MDRGHAARHTEVFSLQEPYPDLLRSYSLAAVLTVVHAHADRFPKLTWKCTAPLQNIMITTIDHVTRYL